jgi:CubicO group peptidase (beta-lactamase class C family)
VLAGAPGACDHLAVPIAFRLAFTAACAVAGCATPPPATTPAPQGASVRRLDGKMITAAEIERTMDRLMAAAHVPGVAIAIVNGGRVSYLGARGWRDVAAQQPLTVDTAIPGASFTKAAFAIMVMRLVEEGRLDLDRPIDRYLGKPVAELEDYGDLASDARHHQITARMLLGHTSGLPNWRRFNDDKKLDIKFDPGTRYSYSGEGIALLQQVVHTITDQSTTDRMDEQVFRRFGMPRTSMVWRPEFEADHVTAYDSDGKPFPPSRREHPDAAGSMSTTLRDWSALIAGLLRGEGLSAAMRSEMLRPQIRIYASHQFPVGSSEISHANDAIRLSYGLGWGVFFTPYGKAYFKEGHDDGVQSYCVSFDEAKAAIVIMTNSDNGESIFKELLATLIGDTFTPWQWENYLPYDAAP